MKFSHVCDTIDEDKESKERDGGRRIQGGKIHDTQREEPAWKTGSAIR